MPLAETPKRDVRDLVKVELAKKQKRRLDTAQSESGCASAHEVGSSSLTCSESLGEALDIRGCSGLFAKGLKTEKPRFGAATLSKKRTAMEWWKQFRAQVGIDSELLEFVMKFRSNRA